VSISGTATEGFDRARAEQLWNPLLKAWFPDGLDTSGLTLIKVHASSAEYWDSPNSTVVNLLDYARAAVTGRPPAAGENHEVTY
jgi:general stress protein 26